LIIAITDAASVATDFEIGLSTIILVTIIVLLVVLVVVVVAVLLVVLVVPVLVILLIIPVIIVIVVVIIFVILVGTSVPIGAIVEGHSRVSIVKHVVATLLQLGVQIRFSHLLVLILLLLSFNEVFQEFVNEFVLGNIIHHSHSLLLESSNYREWR